MARTRPASAHREFQDKPAPVPRTVKESPNQQIIADLLLQKHEHLHKQLSSTTLQLRLVSIGLTIFSLVAFLPDAAPETRVLLRMVFVSVVQLLVTMLWERTNITMLYKIRDLEEELTRTAGGEWEDAYIRTNRYSDSIYRGSPWLQRGLLSYEPTIWFTLTVSGVLTQMFFYTPLK